MANRPRGSITRRIIFSILIIIVIYFMAVGFEPLLDRPPVSLRPQDLKGGGWLGYRLGYAGALILLTAQAHLFRPRLLSRSTLLDMHCFLTLIGGGLILIHAGFPFSFNYWNPLMRIAPGLGLYGLVGIQGVAAWLVLATMASGLFGRYLYRHVGTYRLFRQWRNIHITFSGALYATGITHLLLTISLKYVTAT